MSMIDQLRWKKFPVLDDGFVCLVDVMGDDSAVVQAARVSYGAGTKRVSDDRSLIRYLLRHRHTTPFEMAEIKFLGAVLACAHYIDDPTVSEEACVATVKAAKNFDGARYKEVETTMQSVLEHAKSKATKDQAQAILDKQKKN